MSVSVLAQAFASTSALIIKSQNTLQLGFLILLLYVEIWPYKDCFVLWKQ